MNRQVSARSTADELDEHPQVNGQDASASRRLCDLTDLPPTVGIETAARILGCGRTLAYELARTNQFPCRVLRLGKRYVVPTADLLRTLGIELDNSTTPETPAPLGPSQFTAARTPIPHPTPSRS